MASFSSVDYGWSDTCPFDPAAGKDFWPVRWSFGGIAPLALWHERVQAWLMTDPSGTAGPSFFYSAFGSEAALLYRDQSQGALNATARLLVGARTELSSDLALLTVFTWGKPSDELGLVDVERLQSVLDQDLRSTETQATLTPLVSRVLAGPGPIVVPATSHTLGLLWAVQQIMTALQSGLPGAETWPLSFETFDDRRRPVDRDGLFLRFRPDAKTLSAHRPAAEVAQRLVSTYLSDGANGMRLMLAQNRILDGRTMADRVDQMIHNWPPSAVPGATPMSIPTPRPRPTPPPPAARPMPPAAAPIGPLITCPICLGHLSWQTLPHFRYDNDAEDYLPLDLPDSATPEQRSRELRNAAVRCPNTEVAVGPHFLPANYGRYGPPAIFGFIGASAAGKSHLLATMVAEIQQGGLREYGLKAQAIDVRRHRRYMRDTVRPLITDGRRIEGTTEGIVEFMAGFVISDDVGEPRPMACFDVAGGDLTQVETKHFLEIADGLVFVADPAYYSRDSLEDPTFGMTLNVLQDSGRLDEVCAAIVLNKADLLKFDDPIAFWYRQDQPIDTASARAESADVYAYLYQQRARAWTRPYDECEKATLHVASALGADSLDRPVRPVRVLRPLVALMAMAGLLTTSETANMGA
jgi:hypothetical protein